MKGKIAERYSCCLSLPSSTAFFLPCCSRQIFLLKKWNFFLGRGRLQSSLLSPFVFRFVTWEGWKEKERGSDEQLGAPFISYTPILFKR